MPQGKGTYGSTVGRPPKKNSPMGYNPFKMKGHTLPGIKQRTPANMNTFGVDSSENPKKIATSPGKFLGGLVGGIGGSWKKMRDKMEQHRAAAKEKAQAKFAERVQGVGVTPHGDEAHTGGGAEAGAEAAPEAEGAMMDQAMTSEQADPVVGAKMAGKMHFGRPDEFDARGIEGNRANAERELRDQTLAADFAEERKREKQTLN